MKPSFNFMSAKKQPRYRAKNNESHIWENRSRAQNVLEQNDSCCVSNWVQLLKIMNEHNFIGQMSKQTKERTTENEKSKQWRADVVKFEQMLKFVPTNSFGCSGFNVIETKNSTKKIENGP